MLCECGRTSFFIKGKNHWCFNCLPRAEVERLGRWANKVINEHTQATLDEPSDLRIVGSRHIPKKCPDCWAELELVVCEEMLDKWVCTECGFKKIEPRDTPFAHQVGKPPHDQYDSYGGSPQQVRCARASECGSRFCTRELGCYVDGR